MDTSTTIFMTIGASLLSGIIGSLLSFRYMTRMENKRLKVELTKQILGNRFSITGAEFSNAMNQVIVIFHDEPKVIHELNRLYQSLQDPLQTDLEEIFIDFLETCCRASKIHNKKLDRSLYLKTFNAKN